MQLPECLEEEADLLAASGEDDGFRPQVVAQEGEEGIELLGKGHAHVELLQSDGGSGGSGFVHGDVFRVGETEARKVRDVAGLRGAEEEGLA